MRELRFTFRTDGRSDRALMPILTWLLRENGVRCPIQPLWADLYRLPKKPPLMSKAEFESILDLYPCDLLFVHRDAEAQPYEKRVEEIRSVISELPGPPPHVCVIPVRMQEAWLLINEDAIRQAAGNPNGRIPLNMPAIKDLESCPDPKQILHELLKTASEHKGRRLKKFKERISLACYRVTDCIDDFTPLRQLPAFNRLESELRQAVEIHGWSDPS